MLNLFSMWRSTRVLDGRKVGRAERSQAVVHALLSAKDQAPQQVPSLYLRQKIAMRLEDTRPFTPSASDAWLAGLLRGGAVVALLAASAGIVIWGTNGTGGSLPGTLAHRAIDHDDPDVLSPEQSGVSAPAAAPPARAEALVVPKREYTGIASISPEQEQAQRDLEQVASTLMQALPVRQNDPR